MTETVVNVKTVKYNNIEFKAGTAKVALRNQHENASVEVVGQMHNGTEVLLQYIGPYYLGDKKTLDKLKKKADKLVNMLNS